MIEFKRNIDILNSVCWDYNLDAKKVFDILITEKDNDSPISFESLRYKVLKYVPIDMLKTVFKEKEIKIIFRNINIKKLRNPETKAYFLNMK